MATKRNTKKLNDALQALGAAAVAQMQVREHELKSWPSQFAATIAGLKPFEIRQNDRGFLVGERIRLREWQERGPGDQVGVYTGREVVLDILRVDAGFFGLRDGIVAMTVQQTPGVVS